MAVLPKPESIRSPSWRLDSCLQNSTSDYTCPYMVEFCKYLNKEDMDIHNKQYISEAYLMYYLPQSRAILSSLLLAGADLPRIATYIGSNEDVIIYYSNLFFDVSVFPNKLVIKDYVDSLPEKNIVQQNYKSLMRSAFSLGDRYIAWKMSLEIHDQLDTNDINKELLEDSYWRSREHKPFSIDDSRSKESKSWIPQVLRTIDSISGSRTGGEITLDSLRLKLVKSDSTVPRSSISDDIKG